SLVLLFGDRVHGITIAFGFTLIGVVQDYPIHFFSQQRAGLSPWRSVRALWPTLATGVASTCIAYLTFLFSGVIGLRQLACFTIAGLAAASLSTRLLLPRLMDDGPRDYGESKLLQRLWTSIDALPRIPWLPVAVILVCIVSVYFARTPMWENDLGKLTPVPLELIERDQ